MHDVTKVSTYGAQAAQPNVLCTATFICDRPGIQKIDVTFESHFSLDDLLRRALEQPTLRIGHDLFVRHQVQVLASSFENLTHVRRLARLASGAHAAGHLHLHHLRLVSRSRFACHLQQRDQSGLTVEGGPSKVAGLGWIVPGLEEGGEPRIKEKTPRSPMKSMKYHDSDETYETSSEVTSTPRWNLQDNP